MARQYVPRRLASTSRAYTAVVTVTLPALLLAAQAALPAAFPAPDCGLVPGWRQQGDARRYGPDTLYQYKDGGADAYLAFGFARMQAVTCVDGRGNEIAIDVSEMGDPDHAWGFLASNLAPGEEAGSARQVLPTSAMLARGAYFVEMLAQPGRDHRAPLAAFLDALQARLPGAAHVPRAAAVFPPDGIEPGSLRFVPQSLLGIRLLGAGFIARYGSGRAFVVEEATSEAARDTFSRLRERFAAARPGTAIGVEAFEAEDPYLGGLIVFRKGKRVAGVANIPPGRDARPLAQALAARLPE